ncbi:MAG: hypothetical protein Ta2A_16230 [Treponemataceae bacterium]|nr:MAG: hypothetical protein Ta2A_16230 [Treponemataceae bacterium]
MQKPKPKDYSKIKLTVLLLLCCAALSALLVVAGRAIHLEPFAVFALPFLALFPLAMTVACNGILFALQKKAWSTWLRIASGYQCAFSVISVAPAVMACIALLKIAPAVLFGLHATLVFIIAAALFVIPYILLNIVYRRLFVFGKFDIDYTDFFWLFIFVEGL